MEQTALIVGAGISGLAAAQELSRNGWQVTLLEARERIGGRIHTVTSTPGNIPIELGAEFIHGNEHVSWEVVRAAKLRTIEIPDRHWSTTPDGLREDPKFWQEREQAMERINPAAPDQDFQAFLDQAWSLSPAARQLAHDYVEGFHAADPHRISVHALAQAEAAAERAGGTHQFWLREGYAALVQAYEEQLRARRVPIGLRMIVKTIRWEPQTVLIVARTPGAEREFRADVAVITLPLGVLKDTYGPASVEFDPPLDSRKRAIDGLLMGSVSKVTLRFQNRFWRTARLGFVHSQARTFPTWWADRRGPILTGWAGGPRAGALNREGPEFITEEAIRALAGIFKLDPRRIHDLLVASYIHNWDADPFTRGAYSYTPVRMGDAPKVLAAPVQDTLFFAGEATNGEGEQGTVHGALASGLRAAREVIASKAGKPLRQRRTVPEHA